jgi:hypothetical protein
MPKSKEPKTHFEQIPLGTLKNIIADEEIPDDEENRPDVTVEPPAKKWPVFPALGSAMVNAL